MGSNRKSNTSGKARGQRVRAQRLSPEERKQQLLMCALKVFAQKGLGDGVHADIAQLAGVSVPTTFHYYPTRDELVGAVLAEVDRFLIEDIVALHFSADLSAVESIENILMTFCDAMDTHPDYVQVWLEWSVSVRGQAWKAYLRFYRKAIKGIASILRRGLTEGTIRSQLDLDDASRVVVGLAHMVAQMKFANSPRETIHHTVHSLVAGYLAKE